MALWIFVLKAILFDKEKREKKEMIICNKYIIDAKYDDNSNNNKENLLVIHFPVRLGEIFNVRIGTLFFGTGNKIEKLRRCASQVHLENTVWNNTVKKHCQRHNGLRN